MQFKGLWIMAVMGFWELTVIEKQVARMQQNKKRRLLNLCQKKRVFLLE